MELNNVAAVVKHILETQPDTRSNDGLLYAKVCEHFNQSIGMFPFGTVMANLKSFDVPKPETVRRARQKVQEKNEHLKACKTVKEYRAMNELKYKAFALDMQYE